MLEKTLNRIMDGAKTPEGKIIAILLTLSLALMTWNATSIKAAFAEDGEELPAASDVMADETDVAADQAVSAQEEPAPVAEEPAAVVEEPVADEAAEPEPTAEEPTADAPDDTTNIVESDEATEPSGDEGDKASADSDEKDKEEADKKDKADDKKKDVAYDAKNLSGSIGGTNVSVTADEGALPNGVEMRLKDVTTQSLLNQVDAATDYNVAAIQAIDISFWFEGKEIEPKKPVTVVFGNTNVDTAGTDVFHVDDQTGAVEELPASNVSAATSNTVAFSAEEFSVYVVVETETPRLVVNFYNGEQKLETMYVKKADLNPDAINEIIFDPSGSISLGDAEVFYGWSKDPVTDISAADSAKSIETVRTDIRTEAASLSNADVTINYYAVICKSYFVDYLGDQDVVLGSKEIRFLTGDSNEQPLTVNQVYTPADSNHNFEGWNVTVGP
ncbi:MAG: hypothetical protein IKE20_01270, partial [Eggerthellaceae bacterium]|nr:hypothetical protein [Eggerthellaceae bacterium]